MAMHAVNLYSIILLLLVNFSQAQVLHGYEDQYNLTVGSTSVNHEYQIHAPLRQKREATSLQEYVIDIEVFVTIPDESYLDGLKQFLKKIPYPLNVEQNVNVTDGVLTTTCTQNGEYTQCECEKDYAWSSTICNKYRSCSGEYAITCDCIQVASPDGLYCLAKSFFVLKMSFSMDKEFVPALNNISSPEYNQYKSDIEEAIIQSYSGTVMGIQTVAVTGFRSGSVIVDYEIATTGTLSSSILQAGNNKITSSLLEKGYNVNAASFTGFQGLCNNSDYGVGQDLDIIKTACPAQQIGNINVQCKNGEWCIIENTCVLKEINNILSNAQNLTNSPEPVTELPILIEQLNNTSTVFKNNITSSAATISSVVDILTIFSNTAKNVTITEAELGGFIGTVNNIIGSESIKSWDALNNQNADSTSSRLLQSVELFATSFSTNSFFKLETNNIKLNAIKITNNDIAYNESFKFNNTVHGSVSIPSSELSTLPVIVSIAYLNISDILPLRNNTTKGKVNGIVLTTVVNSVIKKVSLDFEMKNTFLDKPECVFWNFTLFNNTGSWDTSGCTSVILGNNVRCQCEHLTSFSILMSPKDPCKICTYITYIGLGISIGSLVLCLLIEAIVWHSVNKNKTSYIRHVSIVNLALSLLIADIWFIIGAAINANTAACSAATFFTHFFYLALFFWMLTLAILLFFRVILVFKDLGKSQMLAIAFCLGYGCPLIIAVISVAVTAPKSNYTRTDACWLNWDNTMVLLAFVIPALVIITINLIILIVVIVKMLRRTIGDMSRAEETSTLKVVARCIAILTPFLGLTWGFGIGTLLAPDNEGIHVVFTVLNAFQGFFVLVFGTLLDSKIRDALLKKFSISKYSSQQTSTTGGISSDRYNIFGKKKIHRLHEVTNSSDSPLNIGFYSKLNQN
ncbi:adhesion G-protein coupled receptor F1-like [Acipenser ruthenus]|uniref:adhesion G-protein coupled receptor F1-like n=2 Tax=Acipenser ruthenus TaxID=7906 RepID=UPI0015610064|nr:adhesion G-protein coupled receptor F1-like [Acipenser ruthenus]XP_058879631.1 adhesion G-protein coupled receptor F1-like [Acipenser ruthenus]